MQQFQFRIYCGEKRPSLQSLGLPDLQAAREHGIRTGGEILQNLSGTWSEEWRMEITDEAGIPLLSLKICAEDLRCDQRPFAGWAFSMAAACEPALWSHWMGQSNGPLPSAAGLKGGDQGSGRPDRRK